MRCDIPTQGIQLSFDELNDSTQFCTVWRDAVAVATLQRRRVYEHGPAWRIYATDGQQIGRIWSTFSYDWLRQRATTMILADLLDREFA